MNSESIVETGRLPKEDGTENSCELLRSYGSSPTAETVGIRNLARDRQTLAKASVTFGSKLARALWGGVQATVFRLSPSFLHGWRRFLLRVFGARIGRGVHVYPSARVWAPWNLEMEADACLAGNVDCYCVAKVTVRRQATVSQYSFLCTATHDFDDPAHPLLAAPIEIGQRAWVAAGVFVAPGVTVGEGGVVLARSTVLRSTEPWMVVGGVPARTIRARGFRE